MFTLTWQEFSRRPHISRLPLHEQVRQFNWEQQRQEMLMEYVSFSSTGVASSGAGGGNAFVVQQLQQLDETENEFVENDYVENYFV